MDTFPKWLPKEVRLHAKRLIKKGGLNDLKPLLMRLVTYPEMKKVWVKLSTKTHDPQKLIDFLEYVRLHSALQGKNTDPIALPSDQLQRTTFETLNKLAKRMMRELGKLKSTWDPVKKMKRPAPQKGWELLEIALRRAELHAVDHASQDETAKAALLKIKSIQSRLHDIQEQESIIALLELIGSAADYASTTPDAALPKRRNTDNAKRNQLILDLKQYLQHHFKTDSPSLIAAIVNTAFEPFEDGGVTEDDVRKLKAST